MAPGRPSRRPSLTPGKSPCHATWRAMLTCGTSPSCDPNHLDLSEGAFKGLTGGHLDPPGEFNIQWHLN